MEVAAKYIANRGLEDKLVFASQISVQFLNRPKLVVPLVQNQPSLLRNMLDLLRSELRQPANAAMAKFVTKKRYQPVISDLRFVLAISEVSLILVTHYPFITDY